MPHFWRDKHVIITGASSGIGQALAIEAARTGAKVGLVARREPVLAALANQIDSASQRVALEVADVAQRGQVCAAVERLEQKLGPCDVLIANAGVYRKTDGAAYDMLRAEQVFLTNVIGVSNAVGAVLPGMIARRRGNICAVSSLGALLALPAGGAYCASKGAVATLMKSIRLDVAAHGVRVTTVFPGFVDTAMITDHERRTLRGLMTAETAARRILWAIERGRREHSFPFGTWLECWLAGKLPWWLYWRVMRYIPPMEENP